MAFGQSSGPPASAKQTKYLLSLLQEAGYDGFRDARHPLGLTQRQAGGKFSTREASELIDQLLAGEHRVEREDDGDGGPAPEPAPRDPSTIRTWGARRPERSERTTNRRDDVAAERAQARLDDERAELVAGLPAELLVDELERRGWTCTPPDR